MKPIPVHRPAWVLGMGQGLRVGLLGLALIAPSFVQSGRLPAGLPVPRPIHADFGDQAPSPDARAVADWVARSGDNGGVAFVMIDKREARLFVFDARARLRGSSPVLLGAAPGDDSVPGIGERPIDQVRPAERTTPAGRFIAERGHNARGEDVVWVDYSAAVSIHRVLTTHPEERRLHRLATPSVDDNRISYGCINVPVAFYESLVRPTFAAQRAMVYVLPEHQPAARLFGFADTAAPSRQDQLYTALRSTPYTD